ncbi:hypothetical protein IC620_12790 [Hazenella sp. IB182357]|uniref:Lipoprotein n=2 Tax=Polycladospora coralii TaxID=2771432 RepID=A0A926NCD3_9BACL|nr:hypothetical protein [Polycladospora coralii]MBD1373225.1 hypothetical protein [Polycladospora coralii]MBS7530883.1 hypothetical protein [Polycladospora coralii]
MIQALSRTYTHVQKAILVTLAIGIIVALSSSCEQDTKKMNGFSGSYEGSNEGSFDRGGGDNSGSDGGGGGE